MTRPRGASATSDDSAAPRDQELGSMYDYLAKIILLGPSGTGKSCLLHRFVKSEWRVLTSQTIGVEFASKIIRVGTGSRRKRIKLQLWDTAGTERFRSVSRSYYRGAAGAILVYDLTSRRSFNNLQPFLNDARALASPNLSLMLVGNKLDLTEEGGDQQQQQQQQTPATPSSIGSTSTIQANLGPGLSGGGGAIAGSYSNASMAGSIGAPPAHRATIAPEGREVSSADASRWASTAGISVVTEASAFNGEGVDEIFHRLATQILTKIELGDIDPDDPMSGIQYGDGGGDYWNHNGGGGGSETGSMKSSMTGVTVDGGAEGVRRRGGKRRGVNSNGNRGRDWGLREWEEVFTLTNRRRGSKCC